MNKRAVIFWCVFVVFLGTVNVAIAKEPRAVIPVSAEDKVRTLEAEVQRLLGVLTDVSEEAAQKIRALEDEVSRLQETIRNIRSQVGSYEPQPS